ncbi:MAG: DedA family protein [Pseudomonadota bacterium]
MEAYAVLVKFVEEWGYLAVFLGSLVEGESVILTASAMARLGHLSIVKVGVIAFMGTLIADQVLYFVGWYYGDAIFERFPSLKKKSARTFELLHKYDAAFIIACRFIYGIRVTSSIIIGAAGVKPWRFIPLNFLSAAIWAAVSCTAGYLLGHVVLEVFENFETVQKYFIFGVLGLLALIFAFFKIRHYCKKKKATD